MRVVQAQYNTRATGQRRRAYNVPTVALMSCPPMAWQVPVLGRRLFCSFCSISWFSGGSETTTSHIILAHAISPPPDSGHASARSLCLVPCFCPQRKPSIFFFSILTLDTTTGATAVAAQAQASALSKKLLAKANIAVTDRLEPAGEPSKKGRAWRSRACHPLPAYSSSQ
jgi:hypothetical protein